MRSANSCGAASGISASGAGAMRLDGGRYGNLVRQMERVSCRLLAKAGKPRCLPTLCAAKRCGGEGDRAASISPMSSSGGQVVGALPPNESAVLMFSGADPAQVEPVLALAA